MRIRRISIKNFRGIQQLVWNVPDSALLCLIGRGDSTKSTILEALRRVFYPQWNLAFDDADFFQCDPANTICIDATLVGNLPEQFRDLENYGHHLCGWNPQTLTLHDEPGDALEEALRVRLAVGNDLEPSWRVIRGDGDEGIAFKPIDRAHVSVNLLGALSDRHLTWSRGSLLSRLTETDSLSLTLAEAGRAAKAALEKDRKKSLSQFDGIAQKAEVTARSLGVIVATEYKAHLDADAINVRLGGLALHDGEMPLRQLGLGSKRMLTTGLQTQTLRAQHVTLFSSASPTSSIPSMTKTGLFTLASRRPLTTQPGLPRYDPRTCRLVAFPFRDTLTGVRPRASAMACASDVLPVPAGPARQRTDARPLTGPVRTTSVGNPFVSARRHEHGPSKVSRSRAWGHDARNRRMPALTPSSAAWVRPSTCATCARSNRWDSDFAHGRSSTTRTRSSSASATLAPEPNTSFSLSDSAS